MLAAIPLAVLAVASAAALGRWPVRWAQGLIWVLVLQNVVVIAAWKATGSNAFGTDLLYAKEVLIAGGGVVAVLLALQAVRTGRLPLVLWLAAAFGVLCALWIPISYARHEPLEQIVRGLRSLVYPVLLLATGAVAVAGLGRGPSGYPTRALGAALAMRAALWWSSVVVGLSAVVERSFVPLGFWVSIGLQRYWLDVRGESAQMLNGALPWNFYVPLFGSVVRRAFGIMTDPLGLSYFLLLPLAVAGVEVWRVRAAEGRWAALPAAAALASATGIAFSLSRVPIAIAALLIVLAPALALGASKEWRRRVLAWAAASAAVFGAVLVLSAAVSPKVTGADVGATAPINLGSEGAHLSTLLRAQSIRPLLQGHGLGTAGYLSAKFANSAESIGYEDPYLDAAGQVGFAGGLLLAGMVTLATVKLLRARGEVAPLAIPACVTMGALGLGGLISGQLEVITSLGATWLFVGTMLPAAAAAATRAESAAAPREAPPTRELAIGAAPSTTGR